MKQLTDERIEEIAAEQARNVMMPHNAASVDHNQRTIAHAIRQALTEAGAIPEPEVPNAP